MIQTVHAWVSLKSGLKLNANMKMQSRIVIIFTWNLFYIYKIFAYLSYWPDHMHYLFADLTKEKNKNKTSVRLLRLNGKNISYFAFRFSDRNKCANLFIEFWTERHFMATTETTTTTTTTSTSTKQSYQKPIKWNWLFSNANPVSSEREAHAGNEKESTKNNIIHQTTK